jgi:putative tricarboxylic transport membrane protein
MKTIAVQKRAAYFILGGSGSLVAIGYLAASCRLPLGTLDKPGAAVFPILVGIVLLIASLATMWEGWQMEKALWVDLPAGSDCNRLLGLIALLTGYFFILPWIGQIISSTLFLVLLIRLLWQIGWLRTLAYSVPMSLAVYFVFVFLLKVPMPRGIFAF